MNAISAIRRAEDLGMPFAETSGSGRSRTGRAEGSGSGSTRASTRSGSSRRTGRRPRSSSPTSASPRARRSSASNLFNFPSFPGASAPKQIYEAAAADTRAPQGQVLDPHDRRVEVHAQRRVPRLCERRRPGGARHVPHPADVRSGLAGEDERRRIGARDRDGDEADLGEVASRRARSSAWLRTVQPPRAWSSRR